MNMKHAFSKHIIPLPKHIVILFLFHAHKTLCYVFCVCMILKTVNFFLIARVFCFTKAKHVKAYFCWLSTDTSSVNINKKFRTEFSSVSEGEKF